MSSAVLYGNYPGSAWWQEATPVQRAAAGIGCVVLALAFVAALSCCFRGKAKAKAKEPDRVLAPAANLGCVWFVG